MMRVIRSSIFLIIIISLGGCYDRLYRLTTVSPSNTYRIQLAETKTEYSDQNLWPYKVFLEIEKNGRAILNNELLYSGDELDARFGNIASKAEWINEKILKLSSGKFDTAQQFDQVEVHNDSGKHLTYVLITWTVSNPNPNERILVFDLHPNERVTLRVTSNETDSSWIACSGRFENGKELSLVGRDFRIRGVCKPTSHYLITIKDDKALIESQECAPIN
jgi:hypothetical protein